MWWRLRAVFTKKRETKSGSTWELTMSCSNCHAQLWYVQETSVILAVLVNRIANIFISFYIFKMNKLISDDR